MGCGLLVSKRRFDEKESKDFEVFKEIDEKGEIQKHAE